MIAANPGCLWVSFFPTMLVADTALAAPSSVGQEEASFPVPYTVTECPDAHSARLSLH